jgi:phospholipid-transporting ATPase
LGVLTLQCLLCVVSAMIAAYWMSNQGSNHWYFWQKGTNSTLESFLVFFSYFLLYNTMIPISLIVSLEFVKVF